MLALPAGEPDIDTIELFEDLFLLRCRQTIRAWRPGGLP